MACVTVGIAVAALLFLHARHHQPPTVAASHKFVAVPANASRAALVAAYPVLRRAQTAVAHAQSNSGPAPGLNLRALMGGSGRSGSRHYEILLIGMPRYGNVPSLTREVTIDGVHVWFFVVYLPVIHTPLRAIALGNDPKMAARYTRRRYLDGIQQAVNKNLAGYQLYVRIGDHGMPRKITPDRSSPGSEDFDFVNTDSSLSGPHGTIFAVAPAHVARLSWSWPREFETSTLTFDSAVTLSAAVTDDVAVATAPARFTSGLQIEPKTVNYYAADGSLLARYSYSGNDASSNLDEIAVRQHPAPETALSRQAERDPSTPNPIFVIPDVTTLRTVTAHGPRNAHGSIFKEISPVPHIYFRVLLNDRSYFVRITSGPRAGCFTPESQSLRATVRQVMFGSRFFRKSLRGDTYQGGIGNISIDCPGTYRISVSVLNSYNQPYKPFGSATLTVR